VASSSDSITAITILTTATAIPVILVAVVTQAAAVVTVAGWRQRLTRSMG